VVLVTLAIAAPAGAATWPTSRTARHWHPSRAWIRGAVCIHRHESVDWHRRWTDWRGYRSPYAGGLQLLESTWLNAGGRGEPWEWSPREQLYRAWVVWRRDGGSWREWGTAGACGLR
jgi:hypothetical protein